MNVAVILAGGTGARVGADIPKQFIQVMGKPIISYTMEKYQENENIDAIAVVCHKDWIEQTKDIIEKYNISKMKWIIEGGVTFQESTLNGIFYLKDKLSADDIVLLPWAVSPMVTDEIINNAIAVCKEYGNAVPADEMIMCTCIKDDEKSSQTSILRENIVGLNGPWAFKYGEVKEAYEVALAKGILDTLEPHTTSLYFALGKRIYFSKSATSNIKITRQEDIDLFEGYLLLQEKRKG